MPAAPPGGDRRGAEDAETSSTPQQIETATSPTVTHSPQPTAKRPVTGSRADAARAVQYAPGVVIDYPSRCLRLEARVVLREGLLELLACSPGTKEHESILALTARPRLVYEALGLLGVTPGRPPTWDEAARRVRPPEGEPVNVFVLVDDENDPHEVSAWEWLAPADPQAAAATPRPWLFMGSSTLPGGRFAADVEGTVISVVDFGTEVLGLAEPHTSRNDELWLTARTEAIPPVGTRCTLLIRPAADTGD